MCTDILYNLLCFSQLHYHSLAPCRHHILVTLRKVQTSLVCMSVTTNVKQGHLKMFFVFSLYDKI